MRIYLFSKRKCLMLLFLTTIIFMNVTMPVYAASYTGWKKMAKKGTEVGVNYIDYEKWYSESRYALKSDSKSCYAKNACCYFSDFQELPKTYCYSKNWVRTLYVRSREYDSDGEHENIKQYQVWYDDGYERPSTVYAPNDPYCSGTTANSLIDATNDNTAELFVSYKMNSNRDKYSFICLMYDQYFLKYNLVMK